MPGFFTDGELASDPGSILDYEVSRGELLEAGAEDAFNSPWNIAGLAGRQARVLSEDLQALAGAGNLVDEETARAEVAGRKLDLKIPKGGITRYELDMLQYLKQREIANQTTFARPRPLGGTAVAFAGSLAGSLGDPVTVASSFIPVVGQARYAQWLARAGEGVFARAAVRAGAGAIEGAAGAALLEPLAVLGATSEQRDYELFDSFLNVTLGGAIGGGLHVIGGAVYDRAGRGAGAPDVEAALRDAAANMPEATQREMFQSAVAAIERGEPVDVESALARVPERDRPGFTITHVSPHKFDAPRLDEGDIGRTSGGWEEGAGLYGSNNPEVVRVHQDLYTDKSSPQAVARAFVDDMGGDVAATIENLKSALKDAEANPGFRKNAEKALAYLEKSGAPPAPEVFTYEWKVNGDLERDFVDFRKPINEQHPDVIAKLRAAGIDPNKDQWFKTWVQKQMNNEVYSFAKDPDAARANALSISKRLREAGLKGAVYGTDREDITGIGDNFVIYDPRDITPISRNGEPIREAPPRNLADLINQSRADRTQEAFNRQFVDKADEVIAAEKARPKDKIESVKQDEAEFRDMVEEYRGQGRVTAEDDASLKQADELAAWAERRAKAFEAAAGCIEAA